MTRADYSRADVIKRAQEIHRKRVFETWGEALAAAYAELQMRNR